MSGDFDGNCSKYLPSLGQAFLKKIEMDVRKPPVILRVLPKYLVLLKKCTRIPIFDVWCTKMLDNCSSIISVKTLVPVASCGRSCSWRCSTCAGGVALLVKFSVFSIPFSFDSFDFKKGGWGG